MGETLFSEEAAQVIDQSYLSEAEVKAYGLVAKCVLPPTRSHAPSWDHAKAVVGVKDPEKQVEWLDRARAEAWSARKLASEIAQAGANGKSVMRWWLVVEAGTEAKRDKLADRLEVEGFTVKRQEKLKKIEKPKREKKAAKVVTARKRSSKRPAKRRG